MVSINGDLGDRKRLRWTKNVVECLSKVGDGLEFVEEG